jgi:FKBP-type peptidyl-prolyl cis-trans isomerase 2
VAVLVPMNLAKERMMEGMVRAGTVVYYAYRLKNSKGELLEETTPDNPFCYVHKGARKAVIAGVESGLEGRYQGERFSIVVPPEDAYGKVNPNACMKVPKRSLPAGLHVKAGVRFELQVPGSTKKIIGRIKDVEGDVVVLDMNHFLAGETLLFDIEIMLVRPATDLEIQTGRPSHLPEFFLPPLELNLFPFDLFDCKSMPGELGERIHALKPFSMFPPHPWGQWIYSQVFLKQCAQLEGDVIELGVGRGGMSLFLAHLAKTCGKKVYSFDSYEGLPKPDSIRDNAGFREGDYRRHPDKEDLLDGFKAVINQFGLADTVIPVKGFFDSTLPNLSLEARFSFAHLDSDLYASVMLSLEHIYDRVPLGGVIVIDDFFHHAQGPARAVSDFFNRRGIRPVLNVSFPYSVFLIKGENVQNSCLRSIDGNSYSFAWLKQDEFFRKQLEESLHRSVGNSHVHANCKMLVDLLKNEHPRNSDIYIYMKALEDFWDTFAGAGQSVNDTIEI